MRKILLFVAAFLFAVISMPLVFGLVAKHQINKTLAEIEAPEGLIVEVKSYDLGYLSSHALFNITLIDTQQAAQDQSPKHVISFNIESEIQHGPLFKLKQGGLHSGLAHLHAYIKPEDLALANESLAKTLASIFVDQEIFTVDATLGFLSSLTAHIHSSPANYQAEDGAIHWGGIDANFEIANNRNLMKAQVDIAPMLMQSKEKASLDFSRISFNSDATRDKGMPWVGEQNLTIPSFFMHDAQGNDTRFSNLVFTGKSSLENKLASMEFEAKADNLELYTQPIKDTQLTMKLSRIEPKAFVEFSNYTQGQMSAFNEEQKKAFRKALLTMLSPGALFEFKHDMNLAEGPVNTKITIQFPDVSADLKSSTEEALSQRLLTEIDAGITAQAPKAWVEHTLYKIAIDGIDPNAPAIVDPVTHAKITPQEAIHRHILEQLKTLTQSGVLVSDGTHYAFQVNYEKGTILLNGTKMTQEDLGKLMNSIAPQQ